MKTEAKTAIKGRVARILLNTPGGELTKYRVAKLAGCGYPWIYTILKRLEDGGIVEGTRVADFGALFSWWRKWQPAPKYREYLVKEPLSALRNAGLEYALTTYRAENKMQDYLFPSRTDVYVRHGDRVKWHEFLIRDGLVGRGNMRILHGDEHVFYNSAHIDGLTVVSAPQVVLDLYAEGGACVEAAEMLAARVEDCAVRGLGPGDPGRRGGKKGAGAGGGAALGCAALPRATVAPPRGAGAGDGAAPEPQARDTESLGRLSVKGVGSVDVNDSETLAIAESYMQLLRKKMADGAPDVQV